MDRSNPGRRGITCIGGYRPAKPATVQLLIGLAW